MTATFILYAIGIIVLAAIIVDFIEIRLERRARKEREKWKQIDEHAEHIGHESYRGERE